MNSIGNYSVIGPNASPPSAETKLTPLDFTKLKDSFDPNKRKKYRGELDHHQYLVKSGRHQLGIVKKVSPQSDKSLISIAPIFWEKELTRFTPEGKLAALEGYLEVLKHYQKRNWLSEFFFKYLHLDFKGHSTLHAEMKKVKEALSELSDQFEKQLKELKSKQATLDLEANVIIQNNRYLYKNTNLFDSIGPYRQESTADLCGRMIYCSHQYSQIPEASRHVLEQCHQGGEKIPRLEETLDQLRRSLAPQQ